MSCTAGKPRPSGRARPWSFRATTSTTSAARNRQKREDADAVLVAEHVVQCGIGHDVGGDIAFAFDIENIPVNVAVGACSDDIRPGELRLRRRGEDADAVLVEEHVVQRRIGDEVGGNIALAFNVEYIPIWGGYRLKWVRKHKEYRY